MQQAIKPVKTRVVAHPPPVHTDQDRRKGSNRLLVVDDDADLRKIFAEIGRRLGCEVETAGDRDEFWARYSQFQPDALILDLVMGEMDGIELMRGLAADGCSAKILLVSGGESKTISAAERLGASWKLSIQGSLQKPIRMATLESLLRKTFSLPPSIEGDELRQGIEERRVVPFFQPKISLGGETSIQGVEVLARWPHPELGLLLPSDFIPLAERFNLINALTDSLLDQALDLVNASRNDGLATPVSLNLSVSSLRDLSLPDRLAATMDRHGLDRSLLTLELTETSTAGSVPQTLDVLTRSRRKGFLLAMDDFGTGGPSLVQLVRLPFDELKIDLSFVEESEGRREAEIVVRSAVSLAHSLGMTVCAEGVETERALALLEDVRCDAVQGKLFSKPVPGARLGELIRRLERKKARKASIS